MTTRQNTDASIFAKRAKQYTPTIACFTSVTLKCCNVQISIGNSLAPPVWCITESKHPQQYEFPDEIQSYLGNQAEAEKLYKVKERKSRYVVWDIETFPLDQESGVSRPVPQK
jgi:hypothetical protein